MAELKFLQQSSTVLWCLIWTAHSLCFYDVLCFIWTAGQRLNLSSFLGHGCWCGYDAFIAVAKQEEALGISMAPSCHGCISGQAGEEMAHSGLPSDAIPCAEWAPDRVGGLEKHFHSSVLTSRDQMWWIRRTNFFLGFSITSFWVSVISPSFPSRVTVGLMEFLQRSKYQHSSVKCHPPEWMKLQGSFTPE